MKIEELTNAPKNSHGTFLERYWRNVRKTEGCWEWTGVKFQSGYGRIKANKRQHIASRMAYLIEHGEIDDSLCVLHSCDNRACVNPSHIRQGTRGENAKDCVSRSRQCIGERNGCSIATEQQVLTIRKDCKTKTIKQIATEIGMSYAFVWDVVRRRSWRHI